MFELCVITDRVLSGGRSESEVAGLAYSGGADIVQLRMKGSDGKEMLEQAREIKRLSDKYSRFFIVNDRIDIAILSDADGVHLGQSDVPAGCARELLGDDKLIGVTVHNAEEAAEAESNGADYVCVGSVFRTDTKRDARQNVGLDTVFTVREAVDIPVLAIGGINRGNIQDVIRAGADGAAVVSSVVSRNDISAAAHELRDMILKVRPNM
ncbi:MAG: thiamine phosphate synthase [Candidatus Methanoplasma sp.]|jgi:thiamine-phosphate pyrophosphorylase|nr:thiamine phosphate synthase [Candidatus Methanoplasma sp.]